MTTATTTMEKPISPIEQIKQLVVQPQKDVILRDADDECKTLQKEMSALELETKKNLKEIIDEIDPEIERLRGVLKELTSPLEREARHRVKLRISTLEGDKKNTLDL